MENRETQLVVQMQKRIFRIIHIFARVMKLQECPIRIMIHFDVSPKWVISLDHNIWTIMAHNLWSRIIHEIRFDLIKIMTGSFRLRHQNTLVSPRKMEDYLKSTLIGWIHLVWVKTFWNGKWTTTITRMNIQLGLQSLHRDWAIFGVKISVKKNKVLRHFTAMVFW